MFIHLYFMFSRYEGSMNPIPGTFSYRTEKEDTEFSVLTLSCETKFPTKVPYGVSILEANSHGNIYILFVFARRGKRGRGFYSSIVKIFFKTKE